MKWFKSQRQEAVSSEAFSAFLLKITCDVVKDASQTLEKHLNAAERSKLPKVEEELLFFFVFALDYWIQTGTARTQEERRTEFCGMPNNPFLLVLAPDLFTQALGSLVRLKSVQLKLS